MSIIYLTSTGGAPGVSTLATALTLNWPRPALLLEADVSKTSHILGGYLRGQYEHTMGLTEVAVANQHGILDVENLFAQTIDIGPSRYAIPGFNDLGGARGTSVAFWANLMSSINRLPGAALAPDLDVIVDAGRFWVGDTRAPLMAQADSVVVITGNTLPDIATVRASSAAFADTLDSSGHREYLGLCITTTPLKGQSYSAHEISNATGLPLLGVLPWDPATAGHYSHGAAATGRRSPYHRALDELIRHLDETLAERRYVPTGQEHA
jgi:hypothetical protein